MAPESSRGRSVVVAQEPSKLLGRVRFPSPASLGSTNNGEWRSLVAHPAGGRAAAGSNPVSPTTRKARKRGPFVVLGQRAESGHGVQSGSNFCARRPMGAMKRPYGSGQHLREVRRLLRALADARRAAPEPPPRPRSRTRGEADGLTRAQAEQACAAASGRGGARSRVDRSSRSSDGRRGRRRAPRPARDRGRAALVPPELRVDAARPRLAGARQATRRRRSRPRTSSGSRARCSRAGSSPKTVRNVMTFLHSVFALAVKKGWAPANPVARRGTAEAPARGRRRSGSAVPHAARTRRGHRRDPGPRRRPGRARAGAAAGDPRRRRRPGCGSPSCSGCAGATSTCARSAIRVRNAWVRYEHSGEGKSDLSTQPLGADDRSAVARAEEVAAADGLRRRRRPGLRAPRARRPARPDQGHAPVPERVRGGRRAQDPLPRPAPHVRDDARGRRRAAAHDPGVPRATRT